MHESIDATGPLDIVFTTIETGFGRILLAASKHGLIRVGLPGEESAQIIDRLSNQLGVRVLRSRRMLQPYVDQVSAYLVGESQVMDVPLDLSLIQGFQLDALRVIETIPYGCVASYGTVAKAIGRPRAGRAVGTACAKNPLPLVIPCHRVIRSDGDIGNYGGGSAMKRQLLQLEGVAGA